MIRDYYKDFSKYAKGTKPKRKVAWVTAFTPVEILEALDIDFYYPESYAAVIAASGKEQEFIEESRKRNLTPDCCSYSCCFEGSLCFERGPRGIPPKPDVLIAANNQCNTLPGWWNILSVKYQVPLVVIDYPGEQAGRNDAYEYVTWQHKKLIGEMEALSGNRLDWDQLERLIDSGRKSVQAWNGIIKQLSDRKISPTLLFDQMSFLITSRCKEETAQLYTLLEKECRNMGPADGSLIPIFWIGYPLWYHPDRYPKEILDGFRIAGSNYITWWNMDYSGRDPWEQLFHAYNYTFLNLTQETRTKRLSEWIEASGAVGAITAHNKSCKCDFVSAKNIRLPQMELDIDMIDRNYMDMESARASIEVFREMLCTI